MAELEKIARVIKKLDASAPHAVLLVLDATTGQNAISQVEAFSASVPVTGLVMTKLDGTAKGGILVALAGRFGLPVHYIGVGEGEDDLQPLLPPTLPGRWWAWRNHEPADQAAGPGFRAPAYFAATYFIKGLFAAIAVFMVAITVALILGYIAERKLSPMPIFTCAVVLVFGGLALYLKAKLSSDQSDIRVCALRLHFAGRSRLQTFVHPVCIHLCSGAG